MEAMVAVAILGIVAGLGIPSFQAYLENSRLRSASEHLYSDIKLIHSEAIKNQTDMYVSFQTGANWCYGIDDAGSCNCAAANDCTVDGNEVVISGTDFKDVTMGAAGLNSSGGITYFTIDGTRGTVDIVGSVTFTNNGKSMSVNVNKMGNPDVCSADINGYSSC